MGGVRGVSCVGGVRRWGAWSGVRIWSGVDWVGCEFGVGWIEWVANLEWGGRLGVEWGAYGERLARLGLRPVGWCET